MEKKKQPQRSGDLHDPKLPPVGDLHDPKLPVFGSHTSENRAQMHLCPSPVSQADDPKIP